MTGEIRKYQFVMTGTSDLLMHADDVEASDRLKEHRTEPINKKSGVAGDDRSPPWSWMTYLYQENGVVVIPSAVLSACIRDAGTMITLKSPKTFKELTQSGMFFSESSYPLLIKGLDGLSSASAVNTESIANIRDQAFSEQYESVRNLGFSLFVKRAKVNSAKHIRVRPRFSNWSISGVVHVVAPQITDAIITQLFELAGFYKGIGDWRPGAKQSPGRYGTFTTEIKKIK